MKWATYVCVEGCRCVCVGGGLRMCVVNIVNPAVDWAPLLHTLTDRD